MEDKIIKKARKILKTYSNKTNKYYVELEKSFNEYNSTDIFDNEKREVYLKYIEQLNSCLVEGRYSNLLIGVMGIVLLCIFSLTLYTANEYNAIAKSLDEHVILSRDNVSIAVNYTNTKDFNAFNYSSEENYMNLQPLTIKVSSVSKDNKDYKIAYLVYLVENNEILKPTEIIDRQEFKYSISINNKNLGINEIKNEEVQEGNKILLYSGSLITGRVDTVDLRMWLNNSDFLAYSNKRYRFRLDVSGYVI